MRLLTLSITFTLFMVLIANIFSWLLPDYTRAGQKAIINDSDTVTVTLERHFPEWTKIPISVKFTYKDKAGLYQEDEFSIHLVKFIEEDGSENN